MYVKDLPMSMKTSLFVSMSYLVVM